jgi:hypothetical protein
MLVRGGRLCLWVAAFSLAPGCAIDSYPSLGWNKMSPDAGPHDADASVDPSDAPDGGAPDGGDTLDGDTPDADRPNVDTTDADAPDRSGDRVSCATGLYTGQFTCRVNSFLGPSTLEIPFRLEQSAPDSSEATGDEPIVVVTTGGVLLADFAARLDCTTGSFHAELNPGFALLSLVPVVVPFVGAIDGQVDEAAGVLAGNWKIALPEGTPFAGAGSCAGTWSAPLPK